MKSYNISLGVLAMIGSIIFGFRPIYAASTVPEPDMSMAHVCALAETDPSLKDLCSSLKALAKSYEKQLSLHVTLDNEINNHKQPAQVEADKNKQDFNKIAGYTPPPKKEINILKQPDQAEADKNKQDFNKIAGYNPLPKVEDDKCSGSKRLFVRSDPLDNYYYMVATDTTQSSKGAALSYTNDSKNNSSSATINGRMSYAFANLPCIATKYMGGFVFAGFTSAYGNWSQPKKTTEQSALKFGTDAQFQLITPSILDTLYLSLTPFYQTDFRGQANIWGGTFTLEPVINDWNLGYLKPQFFSDYFDAWWQLRAEADFTKVDKIGMTKWVQGNHVLVGGIVRANIGFFNSHSHIRWSDFIGENLANSLKDRLSLFTTGQIFNDLSSSMSSFYFITSSLQYKLSPPSAGGSSSISFEYDNGTDKDTLVRTNQYLLKLTYSY